jgi:uncharacterized protein
MDISPKLASLTFERYLTWFSDEVPQKQAILAFDGDVYDGLDAGSFSPADFESAEKHLRILSGLYGVLKPLDLIRPHRLEMGTRLEINGHKNLYPFWKDKIVTQINKALDESGTNILVNLASQEYFTSIDIRKLKGKIITADFKDMKNGKYRMISFFAKKARGLMTRFILQNSITDPEDMKAFDLEGYHFSPGLSRESTLVFTRDN